MPDALEAMPTPTSDFHLVPPNYFPETSKPFDTLLVALFKFQGLVDPIKKAGENEHLKSTYADLTTVWAAIRSPLEQCGLLVLQEPHPNPRGAMVTTTVFHVESGEWRRSTLFIPARKADAQAFGSALTYCRRYGLMTVLGLLTTDDDGHAATIEPPRATGTGGGGPPVAKSPMQGSEGQEEKGWQAWAQGKLLQLQSCETSSALAVAWSGMQPELKKAPDEVRFGLTSCKDQQKLKFTEPMHPDGGDIGDDVPF